MGNDSSKTQFIFLSAQVQRWINPRSTCQIIAEAALSNSKKKLRADNHKQFNQNDLNIKELWILDADMRIPSGISRKLADHPLLLRMKILSKENISAPIHQSIAEQSLYNDITSRGRNPKSMIINLAWLSISHDGNSPLIRLVCIFVRCKPKLSIKTHLKIEQCQCLHTEQTKENLK